MCCWTEPILKVLCKKREHIFLYNFIHLLYFVCVYMYIHTEPTYFPYIQKNFYECVSTYTYIHIYSLNILLCTQKYIYTSTYMRSIYMQKDMHRYVNLQVQILILLLLVVSHYYTCLSSSVHTHQRMITGCN